MLYKETKRSRQTNRQTKIHTDVYDIKKPGAVPARKEERGRQKLRQKRQTSSTHVELIIGGQERH